ncbi:unnamed protein product, partial [marine sediment metagenome]
ELAFVGNQLKALEVGQAEIIFVIILCCYLDAVLSQHPIKGTKV